MNLTPATKAKAAALQAALAHQYNLPPIGLLLATLTSANKDEREAAKRYVRDAVKFGADLLKAEEEAAALASFANRHEPD
jgi:hypothetical protein